MISIESNDCVLRYKVTVKNCQNQESAETIKTCVQYVILDYSLTH